MASQKDKKGKEKGNGKPNTREQQILEEKIQTLSQHLNPIPFIPLKILNFPKYETLLRNLGLWDFINIDFDKKLSQDLIVECVANYESHYSSVNGSRIEVNRAELARAFKMPSVFKMPRRKDKRKAGYVEPLCEESIAFMEDFMLYWMLLHEDMWMMPDEVMKWSNLIKEGHPEKVDWAGLIWFMMEKELIQGENLKKCYYAAHLQYLLKEQKVFVKEEEELATEVKELEVENLCHTNVKVDEVTERLEGLCIELNMVDMKMVDYEKCKDIHEEHDLVLDQHKGIEENIHNFANDGDGLTDNFHEVQIAFTSHVSSSEIVKDAEELAIEVKEVEVEDFCEADAKVDDDAERGKDPSIESTLGQDVEKEEKMVDMEIVDYEKSKYEGGEELGQWLMQHCSNALDNQKIVDVGLDEEKEMKEKMCTDSVIQHDELISHGNKRLRINDSCIDNITCIEDFEQKMRTLNILYQQKHQAVEETKLKTQIMLEELKNRENMIELLKNTTSEELEKRDKKIFGYEKELFLMGNILNGYKKAVEVAQKQFAEYREEVGLPEEAAYKVAGPGGLMLSVGEIERNRKRKDLFSFP